MTPKELETLEKHAREYAKHVGTYRDIDTEMVANAYVSGYCKAVRDEAQRKLFENFK